MSHPARIFARTQIPVPFLWRPIGPSAVGDASWCALEIGPDALDRRGDAIVVEQLARLSRKRCDLLIVQGIISNDVKVGWPIHRLQQMRDRGLARFIAIETEHPLEAEWIAGNAPVHAIVTRYDEGDLSIRHRTFESAHNAGVAIVARARSAADVSVHLATPQIVASICSDPRADDATPMAQAELELLWERYAAVHPPLPKPRAGHPPDFGA